MREREEKDEQSSAVADDLAWLFGIVWGAEGITARVCRRPSADAEESYYVIPSASRPRMLVPLGSVPAASAALTSYNRLRPPRVRLVRSALAKLIRTGLASRILPDRLEVLATPGIDVHKSLLGPTLRTIFATEDVVTAIGIPPRGPNRKPVLQAFSAAGDPLGYVKIGWNEVTAGRVEREAHVLRGFVQRPGSTLRAPKLVHAGRWRQLQLSISSPLPPNVRRHPTHHPPPAEVMREVIEMSGTTFGPLAGSSYVGDLRERTERLSAGSRAEEWSSIFALIESLSVTKLAQPIEFGTWHGDWVPWNLAVAPEGLYVLDWEHSRAGVPAGLDLIHYYFQVAFHVKRKSLQEAFEQAILRSRAHLASLLIPQWALPSLATAYLTEIALRAEESIAAGAPPNPRFHPDIYAVVQNLVNRNSRTM